MRLSASGVIGPPRSVGKTKVYSDPVPAANDAKHAILRRGWGERRACPASLRRMSLLTPSEVDVGPFQVAHASDAREPMSPNRSSCVHSPCPSRYPWRPRGALAFGFGQILAFAGNCPLFCGWRLLISAHARLVEQSTTVRILTHNDECVRRLRRSKTIGLASGWGGVRPIQECSNPAMERASAISKRARSRS